MSEGLDKIVCPNLGHTKVVKRDERLAAMWIAKSPEEEQEALGVQSRGGDRGNQYQSGNPSNDGMIPSAKDHADSLGVGRATIERWEKDRREIMSDPDLSQFFSGFSSLKVPQTLYVVIK